MARSQPDRVQTERVSGITVQVIYQYATRRVQTQPDEQELAQASLEQVLRFWVVLADWVQRFLKSNPGWKIDEDFEQTDGFSESEQLYQSLLDDG